MLYTLLWVSWWVEFFVIEGYALSNKTPGDTLSEHLWKWFSLKDKGWHWRLRRFAAIAILAWILVHLLGGGQIV